ncbi:MAG: hypothetical protein LBE91_09490 [Tannerella sp.]|jgi:hypothetical protein|nr:hypothetical protein [Tannerella sp.]
METFLTTLAMLALLSTLIFFVMFIVRAIKKQKKKTSGMIALISFIVLWVSAIIGSQLYPVENNETRVNKDVPKESETVISSDNIESEIIISPKNGKKLKVMGKTLTFRIGTISQDTIGINIPLYADGGNISLLDGMKPPVEMKIIIDEQVIENSDIRLSGTMFDVDMSKMSVGTFIGSIDFRFSTTKIPNKIVVYNKDNKSIEFKVKRK